MTADERRAEEMQRRDACRRVAEMVGSGPGVRSVGDRGNGILWALQLVAPVEHPEYRWRLAIKTQHDPNFVFIYTDVGDVEMVLLKMAVFV